MNNFDNSLKLATSNATAADYVEHARVINAIARTTLRLEARKKIRDTVKLADKIAIGLSLQAAELAGKVILRSLGHSVKDIKNKFKNHNLPKLLYHAQKELRARAKLEKELAPYSTFLLHQSKINGIQDANTFGRYLDIHFSHGPSAYPRSYFYPDEPVFTGSNPFQALLIMTDDFITVAEKVVALTESKEAAK